MRTSFELRTLGNAVAYWNAGRNDTTGVISLALNNGLSSTNQWVINETLDKTNATYTIGSAGGFAAGVQYMVWQGFYAFNMQGLGTEVLSFTPVASVGTTITTTSNIWDFAGVNMHLRLNSGGSGHQSNLDWMGTGGVAQGTIFAEDNVGTFNVFARSGWKLLLQSGGALALTLSTTQTALFASTISTADPGSGVGGWLLGTKIAAAVTLDTAHYVEVKINGTTVKLAVAN